jgi:hypothetical protein
MSNWLTVFVQVPLVTLILLKRLMIYLNQHINYKGNLKNNHESSKIISLQYKAVRSSGAGS